MLAAKRAIDKYRSWSENMEVSQHNRGYARGLFSRWRHGQAGLDRAIELDRKLKDPNLNLIEHLTEFLNHPQTRYHHHSLASYLLDALPEADSEHFKQAQFPRYTPPASR